MISCDPGKPKTGAAWAKHVDNTLVACGFWGTDTPVRDSNERVLIELPTVYPRSKVNPNDICTLSRRAGMIQLALCGWDEEPEWIPPVRWKATIPPDIMLERILKSMKRDEVLLLEEVASHVPDRFGHNLIDAIGLGRWGLRLAPFFGLY